MNKFVKKIIFGISIICTLLFASYGAYRLYDYIAEDIALRIKQRVSEGVAEGAKKGIGSALNPFNWFSGLFGHKKKKQSDQPAQEKDDSASKSTADNIKEEA